MKKKFNSCCLEKQTIIDKLKEENKALKAKIRRLEKQTEDGYFGLSTPSSKKPFKSNSKTKNNGGAKKGHKGNGRKKLNRKDSNVKTIHLPEICPECLSKTKAKGYINRSIIDGKMPTVEAILYECEKRYCPKCKKVYTGKAPVLPRTLYGNGLLSMVISMFYFEGIPLNRILEMLGNDKINKGSIINALHRIAGILAPLVDTITRDFKQSPVRHADETGWRTDGDGGYAWLFCSDTESIFKFANTRSGQVPLSILGAEELEGYLITDRYGGYNSIKCKRQFCLAHLLRDIKGIRDSYDNKDEEVNNFTSISIDLLSKIMSLNRKYKSDKAYYANAQKLAKKLREVMSEPSKNPNIKETQRIFLKNEAKLYYWEKDRRVRPDNNKAERELRPTVIARKTSFGSQSPEGAKTRSILMTILHTVRKRLGYECSVADWLKETLDLIAANPDLDTATLIPRKKN